MAQFRTGSKGEEVRRIQARLHLLGIYRGGIDGIFGGGTEAAVKTFQKKEGVRTDGIVGPLTWQKLFREDIPAAAITSRPLDYRCLTLTGSFETGMAIPDCFAGLSGDFDGQGISFGVLQWNFGQGSLQPLLKKACTSAEETVREIFHDRFEQLIAVLNAQKTKQMDFARSIQDPNREMVNEPWRGMFKALGRTKEFQQIELEAANTLYKGARRLCGDYGLWSERAVALMFDIKVQNGSIDNRLKMKILAEFQTLPSSLSDEEREVGRLRIIANRRADAANGKWVENVRARKLCIANGSGVVHGIMYDLDAQFGVGLRRYAA